tara:strand:+ start:413 stop:634 length:222 start_codon:yes stop_codon:yes gene_type:complete
MKNRIVKSWKTSVIGLIALLGLAYKGYTSGGFEVSDFLLLVVGVGFIAKKEKQSFKNQSKTVDPHRDYPNERG